MQSPVGGVGVYDDDEYRFSSELTYDGTETATSNTSIIRAVYPIFSGVVADTAVAFADVYGELNKSVQREGDKTISFTGTGIAVYGFPASWSDTVINQILDPNGLNATSAFTRFDYMTVTSVGLTNNYVDVDYVFYVASGSSTYAAAEYDFNQ